MIALINDLEMSFGKVEVIHETQFQNAGNAAGLTSEMTDELCYKVGLKSVANHELPAVIVIERLKENIKGIDKESPAVKSEKKIEIQSPTSIISDVETNTENIINITSTSKLSAETASIVSGASSRIIPYVDMSMIKISPSGYAGSFLDRHLVYTIEDQNRVINLETGARTCQVSRRFSDFIAVREYLLAKYPFKCIPRLPAKRVQMFTDESFLMDRQKSLRRFLGIISHHHVYKSDTLIQAFLYNQKVTEIVCCKNLQ